MYAIVFQKKLNLKVIEWFNHQILRYILFIVKILVFSEFREVYSFVFIFVNIHLNIRGYIFFLCVVGDEFSPTK